MRYSQYFPKTLRQAPTGAESVNHQLLVRGGYMDQLMAGSWTLLPLGLRVIQKINNIIREELNKTGAQEMSLPLLHPREIWDQTGRWSDPKVKEVMYQFKDIGGKEFGLSFTAEEIVMHLLGKLIQSYKDLPVKIYQFSTKFRNEPRAKSGIMRGREFMMKDLYSAHTSEEDLNSYYQEVAEAYKRIFKRIGLDAKYTEAAGGVFTDNHTHEFQVITPVGEDIIYYCDNCEFCWNVEVFELDYKELMSEVDSGQTVCPSCKTGHLQKAKAVEVGNIFPLGINYSRKMGVVYRDEEGKEWHPWFASYGIGPTRVMGVLVEVFHDDRGIIWPESVAPYQYHLVGLDLEDAEVKAKADKLYEQLTNEGKEVLYDDRLGVGAGAKFADADLLGMPVRLVVSKKSGDQIEVKKRSESEAKLVSAKEINNDN